MKRRKGSWIVLLVAFTIASCGTPAPPRPVMQPLSVAGNFGFSERDVDADTVEVTYRGAEIQVSSRTPRADSRVIAEKQKVRDLALLRAAQIAQERGIASIQVVSEMTDSDIDVQSYPRCRPAPFWGAPGFWGYGYPPYRYGYGYRNFYGWPDDYTCSDSRRARGKATAVVIVDLIAHPEPAGQALSTADTIARLERLYANSTYP